MNFLKIKDQVQLLIDILLDKSAREDERDDAAIDLREYSDIRALKALVEVTSDLNEDDHIVDNCAESIGMIFVSMQSFDETLFRKMPAWAQRISCGYVLGHNPELIRQPLRDNLIKELEIT